MIYLICSIGLSALLVLIFKWFENYKVQIDKAVLINYIVCVVIGSIFIFSELKELFSLTSLPFWVIQSLALGVLFFITFIAIGKTTQQIGVSTTVVAAKMAILFPVVAGIFLWKESFNNFTLIGVAMSLIAVYLISSKNISLSQSWKRNIYYPLIVFLGSGIIEVNLKLIEKSSVGFHWALPTTLIFFGALISGLIYFTLSNKWNEWTKRDIIGGVVLGVPNFFSIYCLIAALSGSYLSKITVLPVNNISIVMLSTFLSIFIFREKLSLKNWLGILSAIFAIALMSNAF